MKGVNHIITGISSAVIVDTSIRTVSYELESSFYNDIFSLLSWQFAIDSQTAFGYTAWIVLAYMVNIVMFIFGCLLPDCDQKNSIMGRMLYVPVEHRTWTHTIWPVMLFAFIGVGAPCFLWLAYGYTLHLFYDSLSKGGICWFYPFSRYKKWASGAQIKKNHKIYLYRTGETSETILMILISLAGLGMFIYAIYLSVAHGGLPFHGESLFAANPT